MVAFGTLLIKLGSLGVKTAAKPLARQFRKSAEQSKFWRSVFIGYAQWHHKMNYNISIRMLGLRTRNVTPLDPEKAVSNGAELLSEVFVFSVAGIVIILELSRSKILDNQKKEELLKKERAAKQEIDSKINNLELSLIKLQEAQKRQNDLHLLTSEKILNELKTIRAANAKQSN